MAHIRRGELSCLDEKKTVQDKRTIDPTGSCNDDGKLQKVPGDGGDEEKEGCGAIDVSMMMMSVGEPAPRGVRSDAREQAWR